MTHHQPLKFHLQIFLILFCSPLALASPQSIPPRLSLKTALGLLEQAPNLDIARAETRKQSALVTRSYDPYLPDFAIENGYYLGDRSEKLALVGRVSVYDGGRSWNSISLQKSLHRESLLSLGSAQKTLRLQLIDAYFDLVSEQFRRGKLQTSLEQVENLFARSEKLFKAKAMSLKEKLRLQIAVAHLKNLAILSRTDEDEIRSKIRELLGASEAVRFVASDDPSRLLARSWPQSAAETILVARENSLELKKYSEKEKQLDSKLGINLSNQLPSVILEGDYGWSTPNTARFFEKDTRSRYLGVTLRLNLPIFDLPLMLQPIRREIAEERSQARTAKHIQDRELSETVALRVNRIKSNVEFFERSAQLKDFAKRKWDLEKRLFPAGATNAETAVSSLMDLLSVELAEQRNVAQHNKDLMSLYTLTGKDLPLSVDP